MPDDAVVPSDDADTASALAAINSPLDLLHKWWLHDHHGKGTTVLYHRDAKMQLAWNNAILRGRGLELGFGFGTSLWWLASRFAGITIDALDVSPLFGKLIPYLRGLMGDRLGDIWIGDARAIGKPDSTYDWINSSSVFEHLPEESYWSVLRECYRLLKPGGVLGVFVDQVPGGEHGRVVLPDQTQRELESIGFKAIHERLFFKPQEAENQEPPFAYGPAWYDQTWRDSLRGLNGPYLKQQTGDPAEYWRRDTECLNDAGISPDHDILDMGCGGGFLVGLLDKEFGARRVTGIDFSCEAIDFCKRTYPWATFREGDVSAVPLPDASFDRVLLFDLTEHLPPAVYEGVLREAYRLLRPFGVIVVLPGQTDLPQHLNLLPLARVEEDVRKAGFVCAQRSDWVIGIRMPLGG